MTSKLGNFLNIEQGARLNPLCPGHCFRKADMYRIDFSFFRTFFVQFCDFSSLHG